MNITLRAVHENRQKSNEGNTNHFWAHYVFHMKMKRSCNVTFVFRQKNTKLTFPTGVHLQTLSCSKPSSLFFLPFSARICFLFLIRLGLYKKSQLEGICFYLLLIRSARTLNVLFPNETTYLPLSFFCT